MTPNPAKGSNSLPADRHDHPNHPANNPAYHPDSYKEKKAQQASETMSSGMDGDHSAKTMDKGASAATNAADLTEGVHEDVKQTTVSCPIMEASSVH